jgi:SAM-dependent methyltransferase
VANLPDDLAEDMDEDWAEHARIWDRDEHARFFADQALASLLEHVNLQQDEWKRRRVLDFGCGTGLLTEKLAPLVREVVAVDIEPAMLDVLRNKQLANVVVCCADIDDPAVRAAAPWFTDFDLIVASCVCGVLPHYEATVGVLAQVLNPAGLVVQWDWLLSDDDEDDDDGLTLDCVTTAFRKADLTCVRVERTFGVLYDADRSPVLIGVASKDA